MKYLLVLVVVMVGIWIWRSNRAEEKAESGRDRPRREEAAVDMVGCDVCGLHCPRQDVVVGRRGMYCCDQHRNQAEQA
ncbi:PP0621 family protein [Comamonadaceae bacterium G21597-S1]|nr:PP0621 family protein [Comamonadaceae bacterium G21597-S1]